MITQELLHELFEYNPETGRFTNKTVRGRRTEIGGFAEHLDVSGYLRIKMFGKHQKAHRLAWLYVYGAFPDGPLDHINGDPSDNRITNLRECSHAENGRNRSKQCNNKSGVKGVYWDNARSKWVAEIEKDKARYRLGTFSDLREAARAVRIARAKIHGEFARH